MCIRDSNGASVCLYGAEGFNQPLKDIAEHGGITALAEDDGVDLLLPGFQSIARLTSDVAQAVAYSELLVIPVPSFAQEPIFRSMLPSLRSGQLIYLLPGNYGSLEMARIAIEAGYGHLDLTFIDAATIPWAVSYTHLDVYKRQELCARKHFDGTQGLEVVRLFGATAHGHHGVTELAEHRDGHAAHAARCARDQNFAVAGFDTLALQRQHAQHGGVTRRANGHGLLRCEGAWQRHQPVTVQAGFLCQAAPMAFAHAPTV